MHCIKKNKAVTITLAETTSYKVKNIIYFLSGFINAKNLYYTFFQLFLVGLAACPALQPTTATFQ